MPHSIFISYSHDSDAHREFVRGIADRLRADGLNCQIDQYINGFPPEGWQRWMETQVEQADFVLLVCTETYLKRYRGQDADGGRGVNFEGVVISQTLYDHYYRNTKFIPVIPETGSLDNVPLPLKGFSTYELPRDYTPLYRVLTDQPATPAPEIGVVQKLGKAKYQSGSPPDQLSDTGGGSANSQAPTPSIKNEINSMSNTMKAAYVGAGAVLLAAIVAGLFSLFATPNNIASGKCSNVITGSVGGNVSANCDKEEK